MRLRFVSRMCIRQSAQMIILVTAIERGVVDVLWVDILCIGHATGVLIEVIVKVFVVEHTRDIKFCWSEPVVITDAKCPPIAVRHSLDAAKGSIAKRTR